MEKRDARYRIKDNNLLVDVKVPQDGQYGLDIFARGLGECLQDLRLLYMPTGGIFLAGSVVRALLESPSASPFIEALKAQPTAKSSSMPPVALSLITQDEAALLGCLAYALARG